MISYQMKVEVPSDEDGGGDRFWMVYDDTVHKLYAIQSTM
jgi:hypothetical protein